MVNRLSMTFTANGEGGEYQVKLTTDTMPSHSHLVGPSFDSAKGTNAPINGTLQRLLYNQGNQYGSQAKPVGGDQPHNNLPPHKVVYYWRRVS